MELSMNPPERGMSFLRHIFLISKIRNSKRESVPCCSFHTVLLPSRGFYALIRSRLPLMAIFGHKGVPHVHPETWSLTEHFIAINRTRPTRLCVAFWYPLVLKPQKCTLLVVRISAICFQESPIQISLDWSLEKASTLIFKTHMKAVQ